jgi:hypothetical protein
MPEQEQEDENTIEISYEKYRRLADARSQMIGEEWMDVARVDDETVRARPVERQEGRAEGELITSDQWLIEDVNGETYTVSEQTFEDKYDSLVTERFAIDLSIDEIETDDSEPNISGSEVVLDVIAHIDLPHHVIDHIDIQRVYFEGQEIDGLPMEVFEDHPDISRIQEDEDQDE